MVGVSTVAAVCLRRAVGEIRAARLYRLPPSPASDVFCTHACQLTCRILYACCNPCILPEPLQSLLCFFSPRSVKSRMFFHSWPMAHGPVGAARAGGFLLVQFAASSLVLVGGARSRRGDGAVCVAAEPVHQASAARLVLLHHAGRHVPLGSEFRCVLVCFVVVVVVCLFVIDFSHEGCVIPISLILSIVAIVAIVIGIVIGVIQVLAARLLHARFRPLNATLSVDAENRGTARRV